MAQWTRALKVRLLRLCREILNLLLDVVFGFVYRHRPDPLPPVRDLILLEPATAVAAKIRSKKITSVALVEAYVARIKDVDPFLNAVVDQRYDDALDDARKADELVLSGTRSEEELSRELPFLGVPFVTKDSVGIKGLQQAAGLVCRKGCKAEKDSDAVALLRRAGGIPLALTNVPEVCMWAESYNPLNGRTNNPYDTNRTPGGSSGGVGSLVSAAGAVLGIGTDIGGSIRIPSYYNGIFGHKPSAGVVSNDGHYPFKVYELEEFMVTGPMCRYATDLLPSLKIMAGPNASRLKLDTAVKLQSLKIYYMENDGGAPCSSAVNPEIRTAQRKVLSHFEAAYGIKAKKVALTRLRHAYSIWVAMMSSTNAPSFGHYLTDGKGDVSFLLELVKWCFRLSDHTFPAILFGLGERLGAGRDSEVVVRMRNLLDDLKRDFRDTLGDDGVFVYPNFPDPAPYHYQLIYKATDLGYTGIFNMLGLPVTQCPLGLSSRGLPLGIQVAAGLHNDRLTLAVAREIEKAFGGWVCPSPAP